MHNLKIKTLSCTQKSLTKREKQWNPEKNNGNPPCNRYKFQQCEPRTAVIVAKVWVDRRSFLEILQMEDLEKMASSCLFWDDFGNWIAASFFFFPQNWISLQYTHLFRTFPRCTFALLSFHGTKPEPGWVTNQNGYLLRLGQYEKTSRNVCFELNVGWTNGRCGSKAMESVYMKLQSVIFFLISWLMGVS